MLPIMKVPILGNILRVISAFIKAPRRFDVLFATDDLQKQQLEAARARENDLQNQIGEMQARIQEMGDMLALYNSHIRMHSRLLEKQSDVGKMMEERIEREEDRTIGLRERQNGAEQRLNVVDEWLAAADGKLSAVNERLNVTDGKLSAVNERLNVNDGKLSAVNERLNVTDRRLDASEAGLQGAKSDLLRLGDVDPDFMNRIVDRICASQDRLSDLNRELSTQPTVWGSTQRLNIAKSALVATCLFNTNSGNITVGEQTFAGSRVSILAGSHDKHLTGFLRKDAMMTEGCDIVIGKGVWLGSGCTLLGPCEVGDNAVIAGGAVVVPGTHVPGNTIYGGIPARKIADLDFSMPQDVENPYVMSALKRNDGLLFVDGWSEKKICPGIPCVGHWLAGDRGMILVDKGNWTLFYALRNVEQSVLIIEGERESKRVPLTKGPLAIPLDLPVEPGKVESFAIRMEDEEAGLFMMLIERRQED